MVKSVIVEGENSPLFDLLWETYNYSFPAHELRGRANFIASIERGAIIKAFLKDGKFIGFIIYWIYDNSIYIEYFALCKECRGGGFGSEILSQFCKENSDKRIILDIDPIVDAISRRRELFYLRIGFVVNSHKHIHPPIDNPNSKEFELILLSYQKEITSEEYCKLKSFICNTIVVYNYEL